eukprot:3940289-Rhodomonas_salina.3
MVDLGGAGLRGRFRTRSAAGGSLHLNELAESSLTGLQSGLGPARVRSTGPLPPGPRLASGWVSVGDRGTRTCLQVQLNVATGTPKPEHDRGGRDRGTNAAVLPGTKAGKAGRTRGSHGADDGL